MSHRLFSTTRVFCGGTTRHFENVVDGTTRHQWWYYETFLVVLRDCFLIYVFYFLVWFSVLGNKIAVEYVIPWRTLSFLLKKWALNLKYNDHMKIFLKYLVVQPSLVGYPLYRLGTAWPQNESTLLSYERRSFYEGSMRREFHHTHFFHPLLSAHHFSHPMSTFEQEECIWLHCY